MSRNYANIITAIWRDEDFRRLTREDQGSYLMLVTQPNISAAGTLPITLRRWAGMAADTTADGLEASFARLEAAQFIVVDADTEELLVRSFVRHDKGYGNPKRRPAILEAAHDVDSPKLRYALVAEFARLGLPTAGLSGGPDHDPPGAPDRHSNGYRRATGGPSLADSPGPPEPDSSTGGNRAEPDRTIEVPEPAVDNVFPQVNSLSIANPRATEGVSPSERVVVSKGELVGAATRNPLPPPHPEPATPADAHPDREGEGADPPPQPRPVDALVRDVRALRPEWSTASIRRVLTDPDVTERPWPLVAAAMLAVARDPASTAPGRLRHDGPWWTAGSPPASKPTTLDPPCGQCGPNRQIDLGDRVIRCPRCHPRRHVA